LLQTIEGSPDGPKTVKTDSSSSVPQTIEQLQSQSILFSKLFVIMGITWIGEGIHVLLHGDHSELDECSFYSEVTSFPPNDFQFNSHFLICLRDHIKLPLSHEYNIGRLSFSDFLKIAIKLEYLFSDDIK
jgi:hypothetical protein